MQMLPQLYSSAPSAESGSGDDATAGSSSEYSSTVRASPRLAHTPTWYIEGAGRGRGGTIDRCMHA